MFVGIGVVFELFDLLLMVCLVFCSICVLIVFENDWLILLR
ncbi:hypothetical protein VPMS16_2380 [Vibrio sp. 16]|nr:hypothetical protein VPMS16_2380 [Vibrio sp. 16]